MEPPDQAGAPVLGFEQEWIVPGDTARAVVVALFPEAVPGWALVEPGERLPMYEGPRVCGHASVLWQRRTELPLPAEDEERFLLWLREGSEYGEPWDE